MGNRATAHLYIANPLRKVKEVSGLFDTHPPIQQRIDLLLAMAHGEAAAAVTAGATSARAEKAGRARTPGPALLGRGERLAIRATVRSQGRRESKTSAALLPAAELHEAAPQGVLRVVVVRHVGDDRLELRRRATELAEGEEARPSASLIELRPGSRARAASSSCAAWPGCPRPRNQTARRNSA